MKVAELLKISTGMLSVMTKHDIHRDDYLFLKAYDEFVNMRSYRVKHRAAIRMLAEENNVSESTIERIFRRLSKEV